MQYKNKLLFCQTTYKDLQRIIEIEELFDRAVFEDWFKTQYPLTQEEEAFLEILIEKNRRFIDSYSARLCTFF